MFQLSSGLTWLMLDASVKALILSVPLLVVLLAFRGISVHVAHRLWTVFTAAMLAIPVVALTSPTWSLPVSWFTLRSDGPGEEAELVAAATVPTPRQHADSDPWPHPTTPMSPESAPIEATSTVMSSIGVADAANADAAIPWDASVGPPTAITAPELQLYGSSSHHPLHLPLVFSSVWLVGAILFATRVFIARLWTWMILREARPVDPPACFGRVPPCGVSQSARIRTPVVTGWLRPRILLPTGWTSWSEERLSAVLAHETAHIERRDALVNAAAETVSILYWFHPLAWVARHQLARLAELACDEAASLTTGNRISYAKHLIEVAALNVAGRSRQPGIAMARRSDVAQRVNALLDIRRPLAAGISRLAFVALIALAVPSVFLVATAAPDTANPSGAADETDDAEQSVAKNRPPRRFEDWLVDDGGDIKLRIRGRVQMPDGTPVENFRIDVSQYPVGPLEVTTSGDTFEFLAPGDAPAVPAVWVRTENGRYQYSSSGSWAFQLREQAQVEQILTLQPARTVAVRVLDDGAPVPDADVQIQGDAVKTVGKSDTRGVANFRVPGDEKLAQIVAWTDDRRIGGRRRWGDIGFDLMATEVAVDLSDCRNHTIRLVDAKGDPIPNLRFRLDTRTPDYEHLPEHPNSTLVTDNDGEAVSQWFPDWEQSYYAIEPVDEGWYPLGEEKGANLTVVQLDRLTERIEVEGTLSGPEDPVGGLLVGFTSFQHERQNRSDISHGRTDANGRYRVKVIPGATYIAFVNDPQWVANLWTGVVLESPTSEPNLPEWELGRGEPVEVRVTQGPNRVPLANASIFFHSEIRLFWEEENGPARTGSRGRTWRVGTDDSGVARTRASAGSLRVSVNTLDWKASKEVEVVPNEISRIAFHRADVDTSRVTGRLVAAEGVETELGGTEITIEALDGELEFETTVTAERDGTFAADVRGRRVAIHARTPDDKGAGITVMDSLDQPAELILLPTRTYRGQVVDADGESLPDHWIVLRAQYEDQTLRRLGADAVKYHVELGKYRAQCDARGFFTVKHVPQSVRLALILQPHGLPKNEDYIGTRILHPGVEQPLDVIHLDSRPSPTATLPFADRFEQLLRNARLMNTHVLVAVYHDSRQTSAFRDQALDYLKYRDVARYLVLRLDPDAVASNIWQGIFKPGGVEVPEPKDDQFFLAALDKSGKELGRIEVAIDEGDAAIGKVAAFVSEHVPPRLDAKERYAAALDEASRSQRNVWITTSQTRCGPCFLFARWWEGQRDLLEKDYVFLKVDTMNDLHNREIEEAIGADGYGIPFHAIVDASGEKLIDSAGPVGNLGHPGTFEDLQHFKRMLSETSTRLTAEQTGVLLESLQQ